VKHKNLTLSTDIISCYVLVAIVPNHLTASTIWFLHNLGTLGMVA